MKPQRIRLSRAKGWRKPPNTVVVSRPGPWGNPFAIGPGAPAEKAVYWFDLMCAGYLCLSKTPTIQQQQDYLAHAKANIQKLRGKNLACWCRLDRPCHADSLLRIANKPRRRRAA